MPYYVVQITDAEIGILAPMVANAEDENDACDIVKYITDDDAKIEARPIRDDVAIAAFGALPEGAAMMCRNWIWDQETAEVILKF